MHKYAKAIKYAVICEKYSPLVNFKRLWFVKITGKNPKKYTIANKFVLIHIKICITVIFIIIIALILVILAITMLSNN